MLWTQLFLVISLSGALRLSGDQWTRNDGVFGAQARGGSARPQARHHNTVKLNPLAQGSAQSRGGSARAQPRIQEQKQLPKMESAEDREDRLAAQRLAAQHGLVLRSLDIQNPRDPLDPVLQSLDNRPRVGSARAGSARPGPRPGSARPNTRHRQLTHLAPVGLPTAGGYANNGVGDNSVGGGGYGGGGGSTPVAGRTLAERVEQNYNEFVQSLEIIVKGQHPHVWMGPHSTRMPFDVMDDLQQTIGTEGQDLKSDKDVLENAGGMKMDVHVVVGSRSSPHTPTRAWFDKVQGKLFDANEYSGWVHVVDPDPHGMQTTHSNPNLNNPNVKQVVFKDSEYGTRIRINFHSCIGLRGLYEESSARHAGNYWGQKERLKEGRQWQSMAWTSTHHECDNREFDADGMGKKSFYENAFTNFEKLKTDVAEFEAAIEPDIAVPLEAAPKKRRPGKVH